jgi:hypothetical protein
MSHLTTHKHREPNYLRAYKAFSLSSSYVLIKHHLYNCRENSTNHPILFKTNPISERPKMNITSYMTKHYENERLRGRGQNKPNSNPNKANLPTPSGETNPIQTQNKTNQTQFQTGPVLILINYPSGSKTEFANRQEKCGI